MSENTERKTFPMATFAAYLTGEEKQANLANIKEMLGYITQLEIDNTSLPFAEAVAKSWIYEQNPELLCLKDKAEDLGRHVSLPVLPEETTSELAVIIKELGEAKEKTTAQAAQIKDLEKELAEAKIKLKTAEEKVSQYEAELGQAEKKFQVSEGQVDSYIGKVDTLLTKIEEVVKHGVVTGAEAGSAATTATDDAPKDSPGDVSSEFGFGTEQSDDFGF